MEAHFYLDDMGTVDESREIPAEYLERAEGLRTDLIEAVSELDEDLMMKYLEGEEITNEELKQGIRQVTLDVEFFPVFFGSAFKNRGVQLLLDGVHDYLPAPTDVAAIQGIVPDTEEPTERLADDNEIGRAACRE